jgi:glutathione S-transferase
MPTIRLHCFAQSGNAFKVANYLNCAGLAWEPVFVDFLSGKTRDPAWRAETNIMGEAPVLEVDGRKMTQSGAILTWLADTTGKFEPATADDRYEALRWMLFDNHKFTGSFATYRFLRAFMAQPADPAVLGFLEGRAKSAMKVVDQHLAGRQWMVGDSPTIADFSLGGYMFYPIEEHGIDFAATYPNLEAWRLRLAALPGYVDPYVAMPGGKLPPVQR